MKVPWPLLAFLHRPREYLYIACNFYSQKQHQVARRLRHPLHVKDISPRPLSWPKAAHGKHKMHPIRRIIATYNKYNIYKYNKYGTGTVQYGNILALKVFVYCCILAFVQPQTDTSYVTLLSYSLLRSFNTLPHQRTALSRQLESSRLTPLLTSSGEAVQIVRLRRSKYHPGTVTSHKERREVLWYIWCMDTISYN